jgi:dihydrofolate reductase
MSLKLIMAVSADGYLADGPDDDMSWTGKLDKLVFKLLTSVGGPLGAGRRTFMSLPNLPGRELVCLTSRTGHDLFVHKPNFKPALLGPEKPTAVPKDAAVVAHRLMTLRKFERCCSGGWLIGGPETAAAAVDMGLVAEAVMCHGSVQLGGGIPDRLSPLFEEAKWLRTELRVSMGDATLTTVFWKKGVKP